MHFDEALFPCDLLSFLKSPKAFFSFFIFVHAPSSLVFLLCMSPQHVSLFGEAHIFQGHVNQGHVNQVHGEPYVVLNSISANEMGL